MSATRSPTRRSMPPSSAGVMNLRQSCVPTGSQRSTYSAPTLAATKDRGVRFRVDRNSSPPGVQQGGKRCQEGRRVGHVLDHLQRSDDREPRALGQQVLGGADAVGERQILPRGVGARRLDRLAGRRPCPARRSRAAPAPRPPARRRSRHPAAPAQALRRAVRDGDEILPLPLRQGVGGTSVRPRSAPRSRPPAPGSSGAAAASARPGPTSAPPARRTAQPRLGETVMLGMVAPAVAAPVCPPRNRPLTTGTACHAS